ncbi:Imm5 family immunity protein [Aquimarina algicola]|uniref:Immunity protein Imm5 domain-containing protein n=1 Tax=Aquimarina algicola TaxID=2589995 RepID=A0A504JRD4_9FLAO|nr:Imm5 family immunity protein [Aquimarina algicola]TPN88920.1 hypothetical protein FHK87_01510 [Aquimarina algicola]
MKKELIVLKKDALIEINNDTNAALSTTTIDEILHCFSNPNKKAIVVLNSLMILEDTWNQEWPKDNTFQDIFYKLNEYLNNHLAKDDLKDYINVKQTYIQNRIAEGKFSAGYAGLALIRAAIEIINEDYNSKDQTDPDQWSSLYIGSLSYNLGAEDLSKINREKNKEFWLHFLEALDKDKISFSYDIPKEKEKEKDNTITQRTQEKLWKSKEEIAQRINNLISKYYSELANDDENNNLHIEVYVLNNGVSFLGYYNNEKIDSKRLFFINREIKAKELCLDIRKSMYNIEPKEGSWFRMSLTIDNDQKKTVKFSYDQFFDFFNLWRDKSDFYEDFVQFPREENFTPNWLKDILVHNKPKNDLV